MPRPPRPLGVRRHQAQIGSHPGSGVVGSLTRFSKHVCPWGSPRCVGSHGSVLKCLEARAAATGTAPKCAARDTHEAPLVLVPVCDSCPNRPQIEARHGSILHAPCRALAGANIESLGAFLQLVPMIAAGMSWLGVRMSERQSTSASSTKMPPSPARFPSRFRLWDSAMREADVCRRYPCATAWS